MTPPEPAELAARDELREMERADPFAPHDLGCRCYPHVSQRAAIEGAIQAGLAEYRAAAPRPDVPEDDGCVRGGLGGGPIEPYSWCRTHNSYMGINLVCDVATRAADTLAVILEDALTQAHGIPSDFSWRPGMVVAALADHGYAVRALASPDPAGLDVERLADALEHLDTGGDGEYTYTFTIDSLAEFAAAVAAEYAALAKPRSA